MTEKNLLEEAKKRYPVGTKIISDYSKEQNSINLYYIIDSDIFFIKDKNNIQGISGKFSPYVRYKDKWAEIVSYPKNYNLSKESILKNVVIW